MGLSCDCDFEWAGEGWAFTDTIETELNAIRRKRCCSCNKLIENHTPILKFLRVRYPKDDTEIKIYGEEELIDMSPWYMCETCSDLYWSLDELGYCVIVGAESMQELVQEYAQIKAEERANGH